MILKGFGRVNAFIIILEEKDDSFNVHVLIVPKVLIDAFFPEILEYSDIRSIDCRRTTFISASCALLFNRSSRNFSIRVQVKQGIILIQGERTRTSLHTLSKLLNGIRSNLVIVVQGSRNRQGRLTKSLLEDTIIFLLDGSDDCLLIIEVSKQAQECVVHARDKQKHADDGNTCLGFQGPVVPFGALAAVYANSFALSAQKCAHI